jgi:PKD repeat protein
VTGFATFPQVNLGPDLSACDSAQLDAGNPGLSYRWSTGDTTQNLQVRSTGTYWADVTNANGCTSRDSILVTINRRPQAQFFTSVAGYQVFVNNLSSIATSFLWDFGDGTQKMGVAPDHTYLDTGTYIISLIVTNICGSDTTTQQVTISDPTGLEEDRLASSITIYPNPTRELLYLRVRDLTFDDFSVCLHTMQGEVIMSQRVDKTSSAFTQKIGLPDLPSGLYLLILKVDDTTAYRKVWIH